MLTQLQLVGGLVLGGLALTAIAGMVALRTLLNALSCPDLFDICAEEEDL